MKTALFNKHNKHNAKFVEFCGYNLPLQYEGIMQEHLWVRNNAGIFDVSHLGQLMIHGDGIEKLLHKITPSFFDNAKIGSAKYTVLLNENGGIIDDLIITKLGDNSYFLVINASRKEQDINWIKKHLLPGQTLEELNDYSLIAIQGPRAQDALSQVLNEDVDIASLKYMNVVKTDNMIISRLGYTGEDGFEISILNNKAENFWQSLASLDFVKPIGLGARDSLRLEAGYPLYGNDLDESKDPFSAGLRFVVSKHNQQYYGYDTIGESNYIRTGFYLHKNRIARGGEQIYDEAGNIVGQVCSGAYSPILQKPIGMAYVKNNLLTKKEQLYLLIRNDKIMLELCKMPFIKINTKKD